MNSKSLCLTLVLSVLVRQGFATADLCTETGTALPEILQDFLSNSTFATYSTAETTVSTFAGTCVAAFLEFSPGQFNSYCRTGSQSVCIALPLDSASVLP